MSGDPRPTTTGRAVANPPLRERRQKRKRVRFVAQRVKGGDRFRAPEAREAQALLREAMAESEASSRFDSASRRLRASRRSTAFGSASVEVKSASRSEKASKHRARSRDGRWTVIPGAYVSRWEPYAKAHEPRQGQPP